MSTPTRRRPSPAVYRRRRLVALLLAIVVVGAIVALVLALWQPWRSAAPVSTPAPSVSTAAATA
ncbi:hypothetical protein G3N18_08135, partial [Microbacterium sp. 2C]|nr:hypothetical protein [Microbacterium paulum]